MSSEFVFGRGQLRGQIAPRRSVGGTEGVEEEVDGLTVIGSSTKKKWARRSDLDLCRTYGGLHGEGSFRFARRKSGGMPG